MSGHAGGRLRGVRGPLVWLVAGALILALGVQTALAGRRTPPPPPPGPTASSPIVLSNDDRFVWAVNPDDNSVSVMRTDNLRVVEGRLRVGEEPQSIALDPTNGFAYVANAADGTVSVIEITNRTPARFNARVDRTLRTGSEPWNVVASPDGRRVFVANSGQDTITVINTANQRVIGHVDLRNSLCNDPDRNRHFQPRGLAVTANSRSLYVTSFFSFTLPGGRQATDTGRAGAVCKLSINTRAPRINGYRPVQRIVLGPRDTGFAIDSTGDGTPDPTSAFPNQLQSIVIRGNQAFLPNVAASPFGPLRFNVDTQAFVNVINNVNGARAGDGSSGKFLNLHLGAREPEAGKEKLFFANVWAIAFAERRTGPDFAYVVSAGSDLLVKVRVAANGRLSFTVDDNTTRYIDLNDPADPRTRGRRAGKNPRGIAINRAGTRAFVFNFVSRNISVVNLQNDRVIRTVTTTPLPRPGTSAEVIHVGAEVFFSSRGHFDRPPNATVSTENRLSSEGWQSCSSCHFEGGTDSVVWAFGAGPRKSVPLNATWNPRNSDDQRVLNYSAIFDEVEDFDLNVRGVSGPGALAAAVTCATPAANAAATSTIDPNHGLIIGDNGDINTPPCVINAFALANANRQQVSVTLPGSSIPVPAATGLREWVRFGVRTPDGPRIGLRGAPNPFEIAAGRNLFVQQGCADCHSGGKWTISSKDFTSPPAPGDVFTERNPPQQIGNPVGAQYLQRFLRDIGSFNLGGPDGANPLGANIGAEEKTSGSLNAQGVFQPGQDALGRDYNNDGNGNGYNVPSLLGIDALPPYYHNGACETLACVVANVRHRTANGTRADILTDPAAQAQVVAFLRSIDASTAPATP